MAALERVTPKVELGELIYLSHTLFRNSIFQFPTRPNWAVADRVSCLNYFSKYPRIRPSLTEASVLYVNQYMSISCHLEESKKYIHILNDQVVSADRFHAMLFLWAQVLSLLVTQAPSSPASSAWILNGLLKSMLRERMGDGSCYVDFLKRNLQSIFQKTSDHASLP